MTKRIFWATKNWADHKLVKDKNLTTDWTYKFNHPHLEVYENIEQIPDEEVTEVRKTIGKKDVDLLNKCKEWFIIGSEEIL
jgi:hypothetical protein